LIGRIHFGRKHVGDIIAGIVIGCCRFDPGAGCGSRISQLNPIGQQPRPGPRQSATPVIQMDGRGQSGEETNTDGRGGRQGTKTPMVAAFAGGTTPMTRVGRNAEDRGSTRRGAGPQGRGPGMAEAGAIRPGKTKRGQGNQRRPGRSKGQGQFERPDVSTDARVKKYKTKVPTWRRVFINAAGSHHHKQQFHQGRHRRFSHASERQSGRGSRAPRFTADDFRRAASSSQSHAEHGLRSEGRHAHVRRSSPRSRVARPTRRFPTGPGPVWQSSVLTAGAKMEGPRRFIRPAFKVR